MDSEVFFKHIVGSWRQQSAWMDFKMIAYYESTYLGMRGRTLTATYTGSLMAADQLLVPLSGSERDQIINTSSRGNNVITRH